MKNLSIKNILIIPIAVLGILINTSCNDLSENVYSSTTTANYYQTTDQVLAAYSMPYSFLQFIHYDMHWSMATFGTDEAVATVKNNQGFENGRWVQFHQHTWTSALDWLEWNWYNYYQGIGYCNQLLEVLEDLDFDNFDLPISKQQMIAEMKMLRAFYHYYAMDSYGNIPVGENMQESNVSNWDRADVFNWIESEILENRDFLGEKNDGNWYGKFTRSAANALLARLYLNAEVYSGTPRWQDAANAADLVINSGHYSLDPTWDAPFKVMNQHSQENIFVVPYDFNFAPGFNMVAQNLPGAMIDVYEFPDYPWGKTVTQEAFYRMYQENDHRINQWIVGPQWFDEQETEPVWGWWDQDGQQLTITPEIDMLMNPNSGYGQGVRNKKYEIERGNIWNMNNDFVVFRLAEVMFIKAEALMRLNGDQANSEAVDLVNQVRARSFEPGDPDALYTTASLTMEEFLNERGREFAYEGKRREDLIRFGKYTEARWEKQQSEAYRTIFPIPMNILVANPSLQQNPGY
jgi:hypothetical protein